MEPGGIAYFFHFRISLDVSVYQISYKLSKSTSNFVGRMQTYNQSQKLACKSYH